MGWSDIPSDARLFLIALGAGFVLAWVTMILHRGPGLVWPMRLYLGLFKLPPTLSAMRRYAERRATASIREQLLVSWFVWFFVLFLCLVAFFADSKVPR